MFVVLIFVCSFLFSHVFYFYLFIFCLFVFVLLSVTKHLIKWSHLLGMIVGGRTEFCSHSLNLLFACLFVFVFSCKTFNWEQ